MDRTHNRREMVSLRWAVRVRWLAVVGALLALPVIGQLAGWDARAVAMAAVLLGVTTTGFTLYARRLERVPTVLVTLLLLLDSGLLWFVLARSGGPANPFVVFFLFPLIMGTLILDPRWALLVGAATVGMYGALFWAAPWSDHHHDMAAMNTHLYGMYVAYVLCGSFIVVALLRLRTVLASADRETEAAEQRAERSARLVSLATLAAGAAHELSTPLGTILVAASELERDANPEQTEDLRLIIEEVERCRSILMQLASEAGSEMAEAPKAVQLNEFLEALVAPYLPVVVEAWEGSVEIPQQTVATALRRVLGNARDATPAPIALTARIEGSELAIVVRDPGPGMPPDVLERVTEPFFTTKPDGRGLGLFYVDRVSRDLGGSFHIDSSASGTEVELRLPVKELR